MLASAVNSIGGVSPGRVAAGVSGVVSFVLALVLLGDSDSDAAAGNQLIVVGVGAVISAFLAYRLAAFLLGLVAQRAGWPELNQLRKVAIIIVVVIVSAAIVLALMLLVS